MHVLDKYDLERMDRGCIEMLESITNPNEREAAVSAVVAKLEETKRRGELWATNPHIPFRMGSMDERNLDERIADNTEVIRKIEHRITTLKLWSS